MEGETASTAGTVQLAGNMLNTKTSRNAMGRKKKYTDEEIKEHNRERARRYYVLHREEMIRKNREWRKANPEKVKGYNDKQKKLRRIEAERKKLERTNLKVKASIFRDPKAAEHFMWLAERVKKKKEQSLNHRK